jgi:hypothetical protein
MERLTIRDDLSKKLAEGAVLHHDRVATQV